MDTLDDTQRELLRDAFSTFTTTELFVMLWGLRQFEPTTLRVETIDVIYSVLDGRGLRLVLMMTRAFS